MLNVIWYVLLGACAVLAIWRGGWPYRLVVASLLLTSLLAPWLINHHGWRHLQSGLLLSDIVQLAVFAWAAAIERRIIFYALAVLQTLAVFVHGAVWLSLGAIWAPAYATSLLVLSWMILLIALAAGLSRAPRTGPIKIEF